MSLMNFEYFRREPFRFRDWDGIAYKHQLYGLNIFQCRKEQHQARWFPR